MDDFLTICGFNTIGLDADLVGCGKPIYLIADVFRCIDCQVPFHRECLRKHFGSGDILTQEIVDEQLRRDKQRALDARGA